MTETNATDMAPTAHAFTDIQLPSVRRVTLDGTPCVAVSLKGCHGAGREMILDEADWRHVSENISPWWSILRAGRLEYVVSSAPRAVKLAQATSKVSMLVLARHLMKPQPGKTVRCLNGNNLDLRRANLIVGSRSALGKVNAANAREVATRRDEELRAAMAAANARTLGNAA